MLRKQDLRIGFALDSRLPWSNAVPQVVKTGADPTTSPLTTSVAQWRCSELREMNVDAC